MSSFIAKSALSVTDYSLSTPQRSALWSPRQRLIPARALLEQPIEHVQIPVRDLEDIVEARKFGRMLTSKMGYSGSRTALVLTAISELARNIIHYAGAGEITLSILYRGAREVIVVEASDEGPGISNVSEVLHQSAGGTTRGLGLSGLKQCMDQFSIDSRPGQGTRVICEIFIS